MMVYEVVENTSSLSYCVANSDAKKIMKYSIAVNGMISLLVAKIHTDTYGCSKLARGVYDMMKLVIGTNETITSNLI